MKVKYPGEKASSTYYPSYSKASSPIHHHFNEHIAL